MKNIMVYLMIVLLVTIFSSCKDEEDNPAGPTGGIKEITIQHFGVDWSEGLVGDQITNYNNADGETIAWCPNGNGTGWGQGIWYRAASNKIMRVNASDFNGLNSIDTNLWSDDVCATPLVPGAIWAAKANDGFVVFRVLEVATDSASIANDPLWSAKVQYKFSNSTSF